MSLSEQLAQGQLGLLGFLEILLKLGLVLGLILLTLSLLKRWSQSPPDFFKQKWPLLDHSDSPVQVLAIHHLDTQNSLHFIQIEGTKYLFSVNSQQVNLIEKTPAETEL